MVGPQSILILPILIDMIDVQWQADVVTLRRSKSDHGGRSSRV